MSMFVEDDERNREYEEAGEVKEITKPSKHRKPSRREEERFIRERPITATITITGIGSLGTIPVELLPNHLVKDLLEHRHLQIQQEYERLAEKERQLNNLSDKLNKFNFKG